MKWVTANSAAFINEKTQEGLREYRDVPDFLCSLAWYNDGQWLLVRTPSDRQAVQLQTSLTEAALAELLLNAQNNQLRPVIIDHQHGGQENDLFVVLVNSDRGNWGTSLHLSPAQLARLLPLVRGAGGRPVYVASTVLPEGLVYRVIWRGISQDQITRLEDQAQPAGLLPEDAGPVFRLPPRNQARTAGGTAVPAVAPFDAAAAKQYQEAWAEHLQVPVEYTNSIGMKFRLIPPGRFPMGSTAEQIAAAKPLLFDKEDPERKGRADSESPEHIVHLTRPYYISVTEVTQQQFLQVTGSNPSFWTDTKLGDRSQAPVERVSWINCVEFCNMLSTGEQLEWAYRITPEQVTQTGVGGYRLPTEAEWEFACRVGTTTLFHTGNDPATLTDAAWIFEENGRYPKPVGSKQPNAFGLSDMHGNVSEWVHDAWQPDFYQLSRDAGAVDPRCDTGIDERRIVRGGNYVFSWAEARSACREAYWAKSDRYWVNGFRVALSVEAVAALRSVGR